MQPLTLWFPGKARAPNPWWKPYYDRASIKMRNRLLFADLPLPARLAAVKVGRLAGGRQGRRQARQGSARRQDKSQPTAQAFRQEGGCRKQTTGEAVRCHPQGREAARRAQECQEAQVGGLNDAETRWASPIARRGDGGERIRENT